MDNHGLLMKFSKIRKKPQQPLNSLAELYSRTANETIHNLALEKKGAFKAAIQGWKLMATDAMYTLNGIERQYPNFASYTEEEVSLQSGIKELCDRAMENLDRVQRTYDEVPHTERSSSKSSSLSSSSGSKFKVHTLRDGVHRMRYNRGGSGLGLNNNEKLPQSNKSVNFSASKSLPAVTSQDPFADFDNEVNLIDFSDDEQEETSSSSNASPLPTFTSSTSLKQDIYQDYLDISEEDLIRLKTLDQLNGTSSTLSSLRLNPNTHSQQDQQHQNQTLSKKNKPPVIPQSRQSSERARKPSEVGTKPHPSVQQKNTPPVQRRNTSINAAVAAAKVKSHPAVLSSKTRTLKPPLSSSKRSVSNTSASGTSVLTTPANKSKKPVSKSSPSLLNNIVPRSNSPTKKSIHKTTANIATPLKGATEPQTREAAGTIAEQNKSLEKEKEELEDELIDSLPGVDRTAAKQIFSEIVVHGDEVYWDDVAGLETAKSSLKEAVVYPFLRPDLFRGLREPVRGMLLFGPPGTGKTMLARAVATESKSTFFSISASSLTSKYLGESEKLVRALFAVAKKLSPSIIFVDEIDSIMGSRNNEGENESSRRIKNEFLVQWSSLSSAAAGKDSKDADDRVLVLAATNLPWSIDEAARRRFVRRQYIPLPESETRCVQLKRLLINQKHTLTDEEFKELVTLTEGYSGSDITSLAKDAAMGPLRELGDKLLLTEPDKVRSVNLLDFKNSLNYIKPSVSKDGLSRYEEWAAQYGSSGV